MMRYRDDLDEVSPLKIDDTERKLVKDESAKASVYACPPPRTPGDVFDRSIEFEEKGICHRWIAFEVPRAHSLDLSAACG